MHENVQVDILKCCGVATISRHLKIMVSFAEYRLFYRDLLQKRPMILRSLRIVATLYIHLKKPYIQL